MPYFQKAQYIAPQPTASAATQGLQQQKALQRLASLDRPANAVQQLIPVLRSIEMVSMCPIVARAADIRQELLSIKQTSKAAL